MTLTPREAQIVTLLGDGLSPKEIARQLGIKYKTVIVHLFKAKEKTGCRSTIELVARAARDGKTEG